MNPARLVFGSVTHTRVRPVRHHFRYPVCYLLLPLSRLDAISAPLFSIDRPNLLAWFTRDHGPRDGSPLLPWIGELLDREGIVADGEIWLQTFPRMLGYVFNPVSFWYCLDRQGALRAVLAEVSNTFGERHNYLVAHGDGHPIVAGETLESRKVFHVSPFMRVTGRYRFSFCFNAVHERSLARVDLLDADGPLLHTAVGGHSAVLCLRTNLRALLAYPWMTLGVMARIHWQALRLWAKRVPFFRKPEPPIEETTR